MKHQVCFITAVLMISSVAALHCRSAMGQLSGAGQFAGRPAVGVTVQLPVFRTHSVRTVVSIPDGGTLNLSGGGGAGYGRARRGRFPGHRSGSNGATARTEATVRLIRQKEFERAWLANRPIVESETGGVEVDGSAATQAKADFLSRNVGR